MDGCPKIKGPDWQGLWGQSQQVDVQGEDKMCRGPGCVSGDEETTGWIHHKPGEWSHQATPQGRHPSHKVTVVLPRLALWLWGGGVTGKPRLSKDKPPQQRLSSPETTRWQEGGPCQLAGCLGCRKYTARSGARPPSWLRQIMGPRGQPSSSTCQAKHSSSWSPPHTRPPPPAGPPSTRIHHSQDRNEAAAVSLSLL